jgi:hypothetical protein
VRTRYARGCRTANGLTKNSSPPAPAISSLPRRRRTSATDLKTYRIVLMEGRFISADGFEISEEGMIAVPDAKKKADDGMLTLSLVWGDDGCVVK